MRKILFIFNPCSGKAQLKNKLMDILNLLAKAGGELLVHPTQGPGDAREAVKAYANSVDLVICSGGDGTLSETINGLVALERCPDLGYIPSGSTNDFAASLHLPKDMLAAAVLAVSGVPCPVDVGLFCGDRHFIYIAAFGMFTEVSYSTPQEKKNVLGHQAYMLESVKSLTTIKSYSMKVECEEMLLEGEFIFGMITNTMSVGGFKGLVSQEVALDDGEFEVMFVRTPKTPLDFTVSSSPCF